MLPAPLWLETLEALIHMDSAPETSVCVWNPQHAWHMDWPSRRLQLISQSLLHTEPGGISSLRSSQLHLPRVSARNSWTNLSCTYAMYTKHSLAVLTQQPNLILHAAPSWIVFLSRRFLCSSS